jgi:16S rRNA (cytidine1402-2'-O)-methyltransferase
MVFFESGHRILDTIKAMLEVFGESRRIAICRELTKTYEEVFRGSIAEALSFAGGDVRGEITIVLAGSNEVASSSDKDILDALSLLADEGIDRKTAVSHVAIMLKVPKRQVFDLALKVQFSQAPNIDAQ